ncbi:MAG: cyclic nucleotide-binding domain-containing protein [Gammaproteobacteria bacterium]
MAVDVSSADGQAIRKLIPLTTLPAPHFEALCAEITVEHAERNEFLFRKGDTDGDLLYLLKGEVSLQAQGLEIEIIKAESDSARFALAHQIPRKIDAVARNAVRFLRLTTDTLSYISSLTYEEENSYMVIVEPEENSDDWMTTLLKSPIFQRLPPANLQKILISLEEVNVAKGEVIVRQGDPGDFYYLIKTGQCLITRKPAEHAKEIKLALLRAGDTFGEDSLLSEKPRNVTITALNSASLLRLSKQNFITLIKQPTLKYVDYEEMRQEMAEGSILLDVRSAEEFSQHHLNNSINTPFFTLRMQLKALNRAKPIIVVCNDGKTSEAAAFLLMRNKFKASILEGGLDNVSEQIEDTTASFTIDDGIETTPHFEEQPNQDLALSGEATEAVGDQALIKELNQLRKDNSELMESNTLLVNKCKLLETEKEEAEKRYRMLYKQTEKLKAVLDNLKKNAGSSP